jgi:hypothetical protein
MLSAAKAPPGILVAAPLEDPNIASEFVARSGGKIIAVAL